MPGRRRAHGGAAVAPGALRPALERRRLSLGPARRRRARLRLHAVREPDPRGRDLRQRRIRQNDRDRRSPTRSARPSCCSRSRSAAGALFDRVRKAGRGPQLQRALGVIMILTALAILTNLDVNFDQFVAEHIPNVNLTASLECSGNGHRPPARDHRPPGQVRARQRIRGVRRLATSKLHAAARDASQATLLADARSCPRWHRARIHGNRRIGSTRRATARSRSPRCAAASCWSTSGPTRASTASARFPT